VQWRAISRPDAGVNGAFIGHDEGRAVDIGNDQRADIARADIGNMERAGDAFALDKGDNGFLLRGLACGAVLGLAADIDFIGFDNVACAVDGAGRGRTVHGLADTVRDEPSPLIGDAEHPRIERHLGTRAARPRHSNSLDMPHSHALVFRIDVRPTPIFDVNPANSRGGESSRTSQAEHSPTPVQSKPRSNVGRENTKTGGDVVKPRTGDGYPVPAAAATPLGPQQRKACPTRLVMLFFGDRFQSHRVGRGTGVSAP
jgi:hypothetical protein